MHRVALLASVFAAALNQAAVPAAAAPADTESGAIAALQARLSQLGYAPGPVNGVMSAATQRAMRAYQRASGQPIGTGAPGDPITAAQAALQRLGFLSAPADGALGPQTRDAIIRFQAANHLPIDPRVSDRLLADLQRATAPVAAAPNAAGAIPLPASPAAGAEVSGRQPLPPGVTPPPIR